MGTRIRDGAFIALCCVAACSSDLVGSSDQRITTSPQLNTFALIAQKSIAVGNHVSLEGGDVGVTSIAPNGFGPQLTIGHDVTMDVAHDLIAPSISLGKQTTVGEVDTTSLSNNGATTGVVLAFPAQMPILPLALTPATTSQSITVPPHGSLTLPAGAYGSLTVQNHGALTLQSGTFSFTNMTIADHCSVTASSATVNISGTLSTDAKSTIEGPHAGDLVITVAGNDSTQSPAVSISSSNKIKALLSVPHGTLSFADNIKAVGAFSAFAIVVGNDSKLKYETGLSIAVVPPTQVVSGNTLPPNAVSHPVIEPVPQNMSITLGLELPLVNGPLLAQLLQALYDPTSPQYHQFLTPTAFAQDYSSATEYQQLVSWAVGNALQTTTNANNRFLQVQGTVATLETVFGVNFNYYAYDNGGRFFGPDRAPTMPAIAPSLFAASGFHSFNQVKPSGLSGPISSFGPNGGSGPNGLFFGSDFRNLYAAGTSLDGTGQSVALVEFDNYLDSDVQAYLATVSPPISVMTSSRPVRVPVNAPLQKPGDHADEVTADIDIVLAMAPALENLFVFEASGFRDSETDTFSATAYDEGAQALFNQIPEPTQPNGFIASIVSCSWFDFDGSSILQALAQMAAQGISVFIASGDEGAYVSTNLPLVKMEGTSLPVAPFDSKPTLLGTANECTDGANPQCIAAVNLMTVVGGTESADLLGTRVACTTEVSWRNVNSFNTLLMHGGGICPDVPIPYYQPPTIMTGQNNGSQTQRNIPDIAALADGIFFVFGGQQSGFSGTSTATPLWAGFIALVNQQRSSLAFNPIGFFNPPLYLIAQNAGLYATDFFDVTSGSNNPNQSDVAHYSSVEGYDLVTGWGSPRIGLLSQLSLGPVPLSGPYVSVTVTVTTGDDDLRCTSAAIIDLLPANQISNGFLVTLHKPGDPSFPNTSVNTITAPLNNVTLDEVAFVRLTLAQTGNTCQAFTTSDNWDVSHLTVTLTPTVGTSVTILNADFDPQLRLVDPGSGNMSVTFPAENTFACPVTCAQAACGVQSDCATGTCLGSNGAPGSGCCVEPTTVCNTDSDCPPGTTCFTGSGNPGTCL